MMGTVVATVSSLFQPFKSSRNATRRRGGIYSDEVDMSPPEKVPSSKEQEKKAFMEIFDTL